MKNLFRLHNITSKYKGVCYTYNHINRKHYWQMNFTIEGLRAHKLYPYTNEGEHMAALAYDMKKIESGEKPVNVLKAKL